ncbi:MAG: hypothetical protein HDR19_01340 [Lachnospiraceae bacterium]|nr:hypothetical protein [Lachnospiraceae bacterium]
MKQFKKRTKRIAAMFLALAMIVTSVPQYALTVLAAEETESTAVVDGHIETENTAEAETEVKAAKETEKGNETELVEETETVTETETTEAVELEMENVSETVMNDEGSESGDDLKAEGDDPDDGDTVEKTTVVVKIPYRETSAKPGLRSRKENLLESFEYAICENESQDDITYTPYNPEVSFDDMVKNDEDIKFEVPIGNILYFKPVFQYKCEIDTVTYRTENTPSTTIVVENEVYKIANVEENTNIYINAYRCFDVIFRTEGAKIYHSLEDIENNQELTELTVSEKQEEIFYVVPEENKVVKAVDSNSTGVVVSREKIKEENFNAAICKININNSGSFKNTTTIFVVAEELKTYNATFDWSAAEADVYAGSDGNDPVLLSENNKTLEVTENGYIEVYVKPKDREKSVLLEGTDEASGETTVYPYEYDEENERYVFYVNNDISGNVSVKISVVDICNITFKAVNNHVTGLYYRYNGEDEIDGELPSADEESGETIEREYSFKIPAGYELMFWVYQESEYGTSTASAENVEITKKSDDGEYYFCLTPTADTTVILDVEPAKFIVDTDEDVDFSVCRYNDDVEGYVDIELSNNNSIDYYNNWEETRLKIKKEAGKRYDVRAEVDDGDGGTWIEYIEESDSISGEEEYAIYELNIGYYKKVFIRSYDLVTINFEIDDTRRLNLPRKFYLVDDEEGGKSWYYDEIENNTAVADKNEDLFIGISYHFNDKLEYISTTGDTSGNLEFYETYKDGGTEWQIYKVVPTSDTTISIKISPLEDYTVTVKKGNGITYYYSPEGSINDAEYAFENIRENSTFSINSIELQDETYIRKVEYEVNGGTKQLASGNYNPYDGIEYQIKITGNTTIYLDAVPAEEYTLKFANTDGFDIKIWEEGEHDSFEDPLLLTNNQITLKNDKEYLFDIIAEDGYMVDRVVATDASGKDTLIERNEDGNEKNVGYLIGTGYGNTGDITVKVNMKASYTLSFDTTGSLYIYQWEDKEDNERIDSKRIAVPANDSYSFYIPDYDNLLYKMTIKESDSFTLTKDYRTIKDDWDDEYRYAVYTVAQKKDVTQPAATATIVIESNNDTYEVTLSNEAPDQIKSLYLVYYTGTDGYSESYSLKDNKANVTNTVSNTVQVNPIKGYTAKVTMTGASETSELKLVRNEDGYLEYGIGELTEDKTITVTVERTNVSSYYSVGFATRNAIIRDPEYKLPYIYGEYYTNGENDCSWEYLIAKGDSISFIAEPDYGYKVESVSARDNVITPDKDGVYTVKPTRDEATIIVRTVKSDNPDNPGDPDKTSTVTFTCPADVTVTVDGVKPENNQLSVETGKQISFKTEVTDESYEIKSVTVGGVEIPYDTKTGTYTITITADTEIIITTAKKQEGSDPEDTYTVRFRYPEDGHVDLIYKYKNSEDSDYSLLTVDGNYGILNVEAGTEILFQFICDEGYSATAKVDGSEVPRDSNSFSYVLAVNADTEVVIEVKKITTSETNYPTQVKVKNVSSKGELNLPKTSADYDITLTPTDADGSVLGVRVTPADSVIKAAITSKTAGGRTRYYLTLEKPESSVGDSADITIYNTATSADIEGGTFKVITRAPSTGDDTPDTSGLKVFFDGYEENETPSYTYTGSAVTPWIEVTYNGEYLEEGTDFTVKYANNINVSTDAKPAKLTITGKGSLSGKHDYTFKITQKNIGDADVQAGSVKVVSNAKATPILVYNGAVLSKKDFDNPKANDKFSANGTITLTGKGNFTGTRTINVEVVEKSALNKISIKLDNAKNKNLAYDGTEKYPAFTVLDAKKTDITNKEGEAYIVVYPENIISAGTVKFTVVGIGDYTGTVTKSYKIKPSAKQASDINVSEPSSGGYTFVSTGVTAYDPSVTLKDGTWLEKGKDYTLAYSNNKKAGTAKCKINFIGNYKGIKAITKEFKINQFNIADFYEDNIIITDKTSGGKPGIYKSVPYIIDNEADALVKSSEFKFTYYVDEAMTKEMKGSDGKLTSGKIWVKIEPKNAAKGNYTGTRTVSYNIHENGTDLSKAKITFNPSKPAYTGSPLEPECSVAVNGATINNSNNDKYNVRYLSNINKGKATVIITGADGSEYVGSKTATFTIVASDIK